MQSPPVEQQSAPQPQLVLRHRLQAECLSPLRQTTAGLQPVHHLQVSSPEKAPQPHPATTEQLLLQTGHQATTEVHPETPQALLAITGTAVHPLQAVQASVREADRATAEAVRAEDSAQADRLEAAAHPAQEDKEHSK